MMKNMNKIKKAIQSKSADQVNKVETLQPLIQNSWKDFGNVYFWSTFIE